MSLRFVAAFALLVACSGPQPLSVEDAAGDAAPPVDAANDVASDAPRPPRPPGLVRYLVGNDADRDVAAQGGFILMGGGRDVDAAFEWWKPRLAGGDVVVLRADDRAGYGPYLHDEIGGCDSVETLVVGTKELANDPYVAWTVAHAEGIFIAGGDQAAYLRAFRGTALAAAIEKASARGAIVGGTSAGCAVLADVAYAAYAKGALSGDALADPYHEDVTLEPDFLALPKLGGLVFDTHFRERDRMGRLAVFVARAQQDGLAPNARGLGIDEATALVVDDAGFGRVVGAGAVYALRATKIDACSNGVPLEATFDRHRLIAGDTLALPTFTTAVAKTTLRASGGALVPASPY